SPFAGGLIDLDLSDIRRPVGLFDRLADSALVGRLSRLAVRNNRLDGRRLTALLDAAPGLREVDAARNHPDAALSAPLEPLLPSARVMSSIGMEFVRVPAGSFLMGAAEGERGALHDEYPQRAIQLTRPFWLGRFAVTREQYQAVAGGRPVTNAAATLPV